MSDYGEHVNQSVKYILVTGGSLRGIGQTVVAASIGMILKASGVNVTAIKISPYFNVNAGNFDLYTHGEIYVLDDGGFVDQDAGIFERFLNINLPSANCITSGKIYGNIVDKERKNQCKGETVQMMPHVINEIKESVKRASLISVSDDMIPDVCIVELGGCVEDIEVKPYLEAFKQLHFNLKKEDMCCIHVAWLPQPSISSKPQTKMVEMSIKELWHCGLSPDVVIFRSEGEIGMDVRKLISEACLVPVDRVINLPVLPSLYHIPTLLKNHRLSKYLCSRLGLSVPSPRPRRLMTKWRALASHFDQPTKSICIALIGKYTILQNSYVSLLAALEHAALACNCKVTIEPIYAEDVEPVKREKEPSIFYRAWGRICKADGILVPGGKCPRGIEGKIEVIRWAREFKKPFLSIGLGFHCTVIEFARNVLGWKDADSSEAPKLSPKFVVIEMPENHNGVESMKVGKHQSVFRNGKSILQTLYGGSKVVIDERHCHKYDVNPKYVAELERAGMKFCANDISGSRMDALQLETIPYFVGVQFHPEYTSRPLKPAPVVLGLVLAASGKLEDYLNRNMVLSPRYASDAECSDDDNVASSLFGEGDTNFHISRVASDASFMTTEDL